jgi:hypothetical protein
VLNHLLKTVKYWLLVKKVLKHCITIKNKTIYFQSYLKVCGFEMSLGLFQ